MSVDERIERARELYERAVFGGDNTGTARLRDALALLDEAGTNAKASAADAILRQVEEARSSI
jgi:hypothetical protein